MPLFESYCANEACPLHARKVEHFYHNDRQPMRPCEACDTVTTRIDFSTFRVVFTGPITARYNDLDKDRPHQEGHWGYDRTPDGKCTPVRIETFQQQKEFCKRNNLVNPKEMGRNYEVAEDGKTVKNSVGMPGCEV